MSKYPDVITQDELRRLAPISNETLATDILDTEQEIQGYELKMAAELHDAAHAKDPHLRRMAQFYATARPTQIAERQDFVAYLKRVQEARRA